jgi:aldose 1-epimerase
MAVSPSGEPMSGLVTLSAGQLELVLSPAIGGSIARFDFREGNRTIPILRGHEGVPDNVLAAASFPLVSYVNRIRNGQFTFRGRIVRLEPNMAGDLSPLHGQGWLNAWRLTSASADEVILEFEHSAGEWPWSYLARQRFSLEAAGLTIELSCRNLSVDPMPCGLGQHPYFHCTAATRLRTTVGHVWTIDEKILPIDRISATGRYDLTDRAVCGIGLDHGFDGWGGTTTISDPDWPFRVTMSSPGTRFFQLYSPRSGGIFVIEPVTHANAALNTPEDQWEKLGMQILMPGAQMILVTRFEVSGD